MRDHSVWAVAAALLLAACGGRENAGSGAQTSTGTMVGDLYYTEDGAPDPLACRVDDDCIPASVFVDNGCCETRDPFPQSRSWRAWITRRRHDLPCADVKCPGPTGRPARPPECVFEAECRKGRCANTCLPPTP